MGLVTFLVDEKGTAVNVGTRYGRTPLHEACFPEVVSFFFARGAEARSRDGDGDTPLLVMPGK